MGGDGSVWVQVWISGIGGGTLDLEQHGAMRDPKAVEGGKVSMVLEEDGERVWEGGEAYAYEAAASVHGIRPMFGSAMEGHNVTVMGRHFSNTGALTCRVGMGRQAVARWLSSTSVVCVLPAAEGRTGGVRRT